jgi:hypothetical protein
MGLVKKPGKLGMQSRILSLVALAVKRSRAGFPPNRTPDHIHRGNKLTPIWSNSIIVNWVKKP